MSRFGGQLLMVCLLIGFGIFFGMEMTRSGIEQIHGPFVHDQANVQKVAVESVDQVESLENQASAASSDEVKSDVIKQPLQPAAPNKAIHRLANKTEHIISSSLQEGVEVIVSLFEVIVH